MKEDAQKPEKIRFVYEKARHHRTFHADGAWASTTPQGEIQCTFFNDLRPLPQEQVHLVGADGVLGGEIGEPSSSTPHIIREANVTVVMSMASIQALVNLYSTILQKTEQRAQGQSDTNPQAEEGKEIKK